jgi:amino-acid N-acetyltransferase
MTLNKMEIEKTVEVILQPATVDSLSLIQKLLEGNHLPSSDLRTALDKLFLGYVASDFIGIGGIEDYEDCGLLRSFIVVEKFRGKGYGRALFQSLIEQARTMGIQELYLLTTTADGFFEKMGFECVDRQSAPAKLQQTSEFSRLCPAAAVCMRLR